MRRMASSRSSTGAMARSFIASSFFSSHSRGLDQSASMRCGGAKPPHRKRAQSARHRSAASLLLDSEAVRADVDLHALRLAVVLVHFVAKHRDDGAKHADRKKKNVAVDRHEEAPLC